MAAKSARRQAFTLIELLVVVAVIGILASLLMPAILRSLRKASAAACTNNLKQLYTGVLYYVEEFELLPAAGDAGWRRWYNHVEERYLHDPEIFKCPSNKNVPYGYGLNYRFYMGPNYVGMTWPYPYLWYNVLPITVVRKPSASIITCDTGYVEPATMDLPATEWKERLQAVSRGFVRFPLVAAPLGTVDGDKSYPYWTSDPWRPVPRHPGPKGNFMFFDGHVDPLDVQKVVDFNFGDPECLYDYN
ncbi:type II secretion system protein [Planctomycetota bacterium]